MTKLLWNIANYLIISHSLNCYPYTNVTHFSCELTTTSSQFSYIFEEDAPVDTSDTQLVDTQLTETPCTDSSQPAAETSSQLELTPESDTGSQTDDVEPDSISPNSALPDTEMVSFFLPPSS